MAFFFSIYQIIRYFFHGSRTKITPAESEVVRLIQEKAAKRIGAATLMYYGNGSNVREALEELEKSANESTVSLLESILKKYGKGPGLSAVMGLKPGMQKMSNRSSKN